VYKLLLKCFLDCSIHFLISPSPPCISPQYIYSFRLSPRQDRSSLNISLLSPPRWPLTDPPKFFPLISPSNHAYLFLLTFPAPFRFCSRILAIKDCCPLRWGRKVVSRGTAALLREADGNTNTQGRSKRVVHPSPPPPPPPSILSRPPFYPTARIPESPLPPLPPTDKAPTAPTQDPSPVAVGVVPCHSWHTPLTPSPPPRPEPLPPNPPLPSVTGRFPRPCLRTVRSSSPSISIHSQAHH